MKRPADGKFQTTLIRRTVLLLMMSAFLLPGLSGSTHVAASAAIMEKQSHPPKGTAGASSGVVTRGGSDLDEVVQSASGQTTVDVHPLILRTNDNLFIRVHTLRNAAVVATLSYPDGSSVTQRGKITGQGWLDLRAPVLYQPLDRSAIVTLSVTVSKGGSFAESVTATVTVLRPSTLATSTLSVMPPAVRQGQTLVITVHSLPKAQVHVKVADPSGQSVSSDGFTDDAGVFTWSVPVSYDVRGKSGAALAVAVWLTYGGQTRQLSQRIPLLKS